MSSPDFSKPQRENALAILISMAVSAQGIVRGLFPIIIIFFFKDKGEDGIPFYWFLIGAGILLILFAIHGYLSWKNFHFYIKDNEFIVKKGYLKKSITALPLEKIVSVNTHQKLLQQLLGVVAVQVDSTGTAKKEVKIKALKKKFAVALEAALDNANAKSTIAEQITTRKSEQEILKLSIWQLFKVGISRNHINGLLLLLVFANQIRTQLQDLFKNEVDEVLDQTTNYLEHSDILMWGIIVIFLISVAFLISIVRTFLTYFDLKIVARKSSFHLQNGLLKRKKVLVPFSRIQAIKIVSNPLQRWLKMNTIHIVQASVKKTEKESEKILLPGATKRQVAELLQTVFLQTLSKKQTLKPHWTYRNRLFFTNCFPLFLILPFAYFYWSILLAIPVFIFWGIVSAFVGYRRCEYIINDELLHIKKGVLVKSEIRLLHYKTQSVRLSQNIFQRRRKTASLRIGVAGETVRMINLPIEKATQLKDFLLYKVENSSKGWL